MLNGNNISNGLPAGEPNGCEQLKLSGKQTQQWADTMSMMAWTCPGFRHLWYKMLSASHNAGKNAHVAVMSKEVPIAATDGCNMIINPDTFFDFSLPERTFIAAHEILHNMYGDVALLHRCTISGKVPMTDGTDLPFDNPTMQRSMDLRNDALLIQSKIGKPPQISIDRLKGFDLGKTALEAVIDIYAREYKKKPDGGPDGGDGGGENGRGANPGGFDQVLPPGSSTGQTPRQALQDHNAQQWAVEIAAAQTIELMRSHGNMAAALKRMFKQILEPEISWLDHIETLITRTTGSGSTNWRQPDEWFIGRGIYQPHKTGRGAGWIVIWGDTSGSRSEQEITSSIAELHGILEDVNPKRLTVIWCDAAIGFIDEIYDAADLEKIKSRGTAGGGGTSMNPVLQWIDDQMGTPELFIGFTDGAVTFPEREPRYPVIWASSTDCKYPFGQVVRVNKVTRG